MPPTLLNGGGVGELGRTRREVSVFGRSIRLNVELDHAKRCKWSPDNRALVLCTALANRVHVYRVKRREDGSPGTAEPLLQFRDAHRSSELINVGIACNGNFIMSISMDTTLCVWSLKVPQRRQQWRHVVRCPGEI
ncbi:hypothetical protein MTO96_051413 [Rhipicephalus appendiculatus]